MGESTFTGPDAYEEAVVDVQTDDGWVTLGREGVLAGTAWQSTEPVYVITAYNPGRAAPHEDNQAAQRRLVDHLNHEQLSWLPALGRSRDARHQEPSAALMGVDEQVALEIAIRFGQDAIFRWAQGTLTVVPCATAD